MPSERVQRQVDRLLDEAEAAVDREDWSAVAGLAQRILVMDPENADALAYQEIAEGGLSFPAKGTEIWDVKVLDNPKVEDLALTIAVFVVFGRADFRSSGINRGGHDGVHILDKKSDDGRYAFALFRCMKIRLGYLMHMEYRAVDRKLGNMNAAIVVPEGKILRCAEGS